MTNVSAVPSRNLLCLALFSWDGFRRHECVSRIVLNRQSAMVATVLLVKGLRALLKGTTVLDGKDRGSSAAVSLPYLDYS